jgi:hypothetical protein
MSAKDVQDLLQRQPVLAEADAAQLAASMASARQELGINGRSVRLLVRREPKMLLRMTSSQISEAAQRLAGELRVPKSAVLKAASTAPSILRRDPAVVSSRLHSMSAKLGGISMPDMLQLVAGAPQYLTEAPSKLERRLAEACRALHRPPRLVVKALLLQADLLFMSPRILANKLKVCTHQCTGGGAGGLVQAVSRASKVAACPHGINRTLSPMGQGFMRKATVAMHAWDVWGVTAGPACTLGMDLMCRHTRDNACRCCKAYLTRMRVRSRLWC